MKWLCMLFRGKIKNSGIEFPTAFITILPRSAAAIWPILLMSFTRMTFTVFDGTVEKTEQIDYKQAPFHGDFLLAWAPGGSLQSEYMLSGAI